MRQPHLREHKQLQSTCVSHEKVPRRYFRADTNTGHSNGMHPQEVPRPAADVRQGLDRHAPPHATTKASWTWSTGVMILIGPLVLSETHPATIITTCPEPSHKVSIGTAFLSKKEIETPPRLFVT